MKRMSYCITYIFLGILSLLYTSCVNEILADGEPMVEEGLPATVKVNFKSMTAAVYTRAASPTDDENKVNNIYILIFNQDKEKVFGQYFEPNASTGDKTISITTTSGKRTIYGIANIGLGMMSTTKEELDQVTSLEELKAKVSHLEQLTMARGASFLMSGMVEESEGSQTPKTVLIQPGSSNALGTINLYRVDAKITFNITTVEGVTFTPREWRVVKASKSVYLLPASTDPVSISDEDYMESNWANFEGEGESFGKTFSFYTLENRKEAKKSILKVVGDTVPDAQERYAYREKQIKELPEEGAILLPGQEVVNGAYEYANDNSTYVQMTGTVSYPGTAGRDVVADVTYTIHLGYIDNNPDNYETKRNTSYTYTVTIESVDKILLEVNDSVEKQPGAEGEVTLANKIINLDSHYETRVISFPTTQIDESLTWYVNTPFSTGMESINPDDYKWIYFLRNKRQNSSSSNYSDAGRTYPGDKYYRPDPITLVDYIKEADTRLLDVKQLVTILKEGKKAKSKDIFDNAGEGVATFTAFVNENYYDKNPRTGEESPTLWKQFVNMPDRVMNILSMTRYSLDGASSRTLAVVSFRQKAIQTMYNPMADAGLQTAWGGECVREPNDELSFWSNRIYSLLTYDSPSDGRGNTLNLWRVGGKWDTYVNPTTNTMQDTYKYARYVCMQRNRDNNGDNTIDKNEVRWYLASINQLTDLWIGENSFDADARLFKGTKWNEDWYVSSTVTNRSDSKDDPMVLWSSEGSSTGLMSATGNSSDKYNYRCVRSLGIDLNSDEQPHDFAEYKSSTGILSLQYLDGKSIRAYKQEAELPEHHERMADNLPRWEFQVENATHGSELNWTDVNTRIKNGKSPCPSGWRVPNQRELALMLSRIGDDGKWSLNNHMSRTRFSMNSVGGARVGFSVTKNAGILFLINNSNERGGVRCVKDVK